MKEQQPRASQTSAWYDDQPFDIGDRVRIVDQAEQQAAGGTAGRVVGYDAAGPRRGEDCIRVLVYVDGPVARIVALPPHTLSREDAAAERAGLARTMLVQWQQSLGPDRFAQLRDWLRGEACARILADPALPRQNIRLGSLAIPGFLLPDLARLAQEQ